MTSFKSKADADRHGRLAHARNAYKNPFGNVCKFKVNGVPFMLKFGIFLLTMLLGPPPPPPQKCAIEFHLYSSARIV